MNELEKTDSQNESHQNNTASLRLIKIVALAVLVGVVISLVLYSQPKFFIFQESYPPNTITLTEEGYEPKELHIAKGTTVVFRNETGRPHWPASNLHPGHEIYPEFDPMAPVAADESWSFTFDKVGKWRMHDHIRAYYTGTIIVTEE